MSVDFRLDPGFERALLRTDGVRRMLEQPVAAAASLAADLAPDDPDTGAPDLHTSVYGDVDLTGRGWVGRVGATNFKAMWFEEGTVRNEPRPFLRPAVEIEIGPVVASPLEEE